jgi:hypothetical protein
MEQQTQQSPVQTVEPNPSVAPQPQKSGGKVWLWILGGCLTIVILSLLVMGGLAWWGAIKVKKAIQENQPKLEQMQKNAADWQKQMEKAQQEAQKNLPSTGSVENNTTQDADNSLPQ